MSDNSHCNCEQALRLQAEVGELKAALARWTEYDKLIADGRTVTQVSQLEADLLRENEQLQSTLREVGTALTGVECGPGQDFTGNPYVDGVAALRAEVERLRGAIGHHETMRAAWESEASQLRTEVERLQGQRNDLIGCEIAAVQEAEQLRALLGECVGELEVFVGYLSNEGDSTFAVRDLLSRIRAALGGGQ